MAYDNWERKCIRTRYTTTSPIEISREDLQSEVDKVTSENIQKLPTSEARHMETTLLQRYKTLQRQQIAAPLTDFARPLDLLVAVSKQK